MEKVALPESALRGGGRAGERSNARSLALSGSGGRLGLRWAFSRGVLGTEVQLVACVVVEVVRVDFVGGLSCAMAFDRMRMVVHCSLVGDEEAVERTLPDDSSQVVDVRSVLDNVPVVYA